MIIHNLKSLKTFNDYGIGVPLLSERATLVHEALTAHPVLGKRIADWLYCEDVPEIDEQDILRVHCREYVQNVLRDNPEEIVKETYELNDTQGDCVRYNPEQAKRPLRELVDKALANVAGTHKSSLLALEKGFCFFLGGGMHHAMSDEGRGFCLLNDIVVSARKLQASGLARKIWIIDVDAHKGDGTAELCLANQDILTLSVHMAEGWPLDSSPLDKEGRLKRCCYPNTVDVPIPVGGEDYYLQGLKNGLEILETAAGGERPDLAIVVDGSDPYVLDELPSAGLLKLSLEQMLERDMLIYRFLQQRSIPQSYLMAGGYGKNSWQVYAQFLTTVLLQRLTD